MEAVGYGPALGVSGHGEGTRAIGENTAGPLIGQQEDHSRPGYWFVVFIFNLDDRFPGRPLAYVVDGAVTINDD